MTQLALDLHRIAPPSLANFVAGDNGEALARLVAMAAGDRSARFIYLWGEPGSGRSHLLQAQVPGRVLAPTSPLEDFRRDVEERDDEAARFATPRVFAADDVHLFDGPRQEALFHLFNRVLARPGDALVCAGAQPPLALSLRDDLRTRLGWGLVFELRLLDDAHKAAAIRRAADERGVPLSSDFIPWLLTHRSRDIRELLAVFDAVDRYAFQRKRPITLPLLREWLSRPEQDAADAGAADDATGNDLAPPDPAGKIL